MTLREISREYEASAALLRRRLKQLRQELVYDPESNTCQVEFRREKEPGKLERVFAAKVLY